MLYCPMCYNNTLKIAHHGVVNLVVNGKQMDTGRFLFNLDKESKQEIISNFAKKLEEFFKWYANFKNQDPITYLKAFTSDFVCENGCTIGLRYHFTIVDVLIPRKKIMAMIARLGDKYNMKIELEVE